MDSNTFSELVGEIYECPLDISRWPATIARIQEQLGALCSYLLIHETDPNAPGLNLLVQNDVDQGMRLRYQQHYIGINPLLPYLASAGNGELYCCRHLVTKPDYQQGEFYREFAQPQDWFDYAGVTLIREGEMSAAVGFTRGGHGRVFEDASLELLRRLAPHLTRAAQIQRLIERERRKRADALAVVDEMRFGVAIVDPSARPMEMNRAAQTLAGRMGWFRSASGILMAGDSTAAFHASIRSACRTKDGHASGATLRVERGPERRPLTLHILPLAEAGTGFFHFSPARAVVFMIDPEDQPASSLHLFAETYKLTVAERQVLDRLATGESPAEIARSMDIAMPTVRTHLHRIFEKTGTRRQAELIKLYLEFSPFPKR